MSEKINVQEYIKEIEKLTEEIRNAYFWIGNDAGPASTYCWWEPTINDTINVAHKLSELNNECSRLKWGIERRISDFARSRNCECKDKKITFSFNLA